MNEILSRKLAATATAPVVRLDSKWISDGSWPKHLRRRANASVSFLLTKHGSVLCDDLAVGFLAERTDTMTVSGPDGCERWAIIAIRYPDMRYRFAVRCTAWEKHPPFPGLGLTDREVELVYLMCDELSRRKAYTDDVFDVADELFDNIDDNVQIAQELGNFDEQRFLALLKNDPLALPVLEAALLSAVWTAPNMEYLPAFLLNFMLPNAQSATVREGVDEHFHAVDLLRSPDAPFERVFTFRFENASLPVYPLSAAGRMIVLEPIGDPARKALTDALTEIAHVRHNIGDAADRPLPAFPVTVARAFPSHLAHNVEVPKDVHVLTDAEADLLRLAAAKLLRHVPTVVSDLNDALSDSSARSNAYRYKAPERWISLVLLYIRKALLTRKDCREAFDKLTARMMREQREAQVQRTSTIDNGVAFVLDPARYKDAISPRPKTLEQLDETVAFPYASRGVPMLVYNTAQFERLLQRAGVGSELVPDVVQALKERSIFERENIIINTDGTSRRFFAIPVKKFVNSVIPAIPAGQEEDNDV